MMDDTTREFFHRGAQLFESGDYADAMSVFQQIVDLKEDADSDKAMACVNLAMISDRMGNTDQALAWYRRGAEFATRLVYWIEESTAVYLMSKDRNAEAISILTQLLESQDLDPADHHRIENNLSDAKRRADMVDRF